MAATLTGAVLEQVSTRFNAAIKAQEAYTVANTGATNKNGRFVNVDRDGTPWKGIVVATPFGPKDGTFLGVHNAVAVLEKVLTELGVKVEPYSYDKNTRSLAGTLIAVLDTLATAKKLTVVHGKGLRIYGPDMIDAVNGKAVKVVPDTKDLF